MKEELVLVRNETFKDFPIGNFPFDPHHSAMGEYHCYIPEGYRGNWYDPVVYHGWNGSGPTWIVTEEDGKKFMEQTRVLAVLKNLWPMLVTGDEFWQDYLVEAQVHKKKTRKMEFFIPIFLYLLKIKLLSIKLLSRYAIKPV
ncbi:hypothetical protein [Caldicellulosiruptor acetigenus]|uniref:hypothetical protein n=1 Tax=Caldicellulosiruptor acetigenus TaxID=301953 RepID=UPI0003FE7F9C|nr:hypothetical protein [Caldicellulosiruptor acetigenus]WAM36425.1 hypothetical protein OTK01_000187 [Caldicellulosiruptor acetigenus]